MGRPKGSRNKPKIKNVEKEIDAQVAKMQTPEAKQAARELFTTDFRAVAPADLSKNQAVYDFTKAQMLALAEEYGAETLEDRLWNRAANVLTATSLSEADSIAKGVIDATLTHLLAAWGRGKIPGKLSERTVRTNITKALALADFLDAKGLTDQAESQRLRAAKLDSEWQSFKETKKNE